MTVSFHELTTAFRTIGLNRRYPVIAHVSISAFGEVRGGAESVLGALMATTNGLMMPAFTYETMVIPEVGPAANGLSYGSGKSLNRMAQFFTSDMSVDPLMGSVAELLRCHPQARRSMHPILSFAGVGVENLLKHQTTQDPLGPIEALAEEDGWVVLLGVDHTVNTSIHCAEALAGRRQFTRWALTAEGVRECPGFPGCSNGFNDIAPHLAGTTRVTQVGGATIQAVPLQDLFSAVFDMLESDPLALLCDRSDCERCSSVRTAVQRAV